VCTLPSRLKLYIHNACKNKLLAERLTPMYNLVCEQLIPQYILQHIESLTLVNNLHHLLLLLTQKT
jgi:hypothetical protein